MMNTALKLSFSSKNLVFKQCLFSKKKIKKVSSLFNSHFFSSAPIKNVETTQNNRPVLYHSSLQNDSFHIIRSTRWTKQEVILLNELKNSPKQSFFSVARELLPHRSLSSIKAKILSLKSKCFFGNIFTVLEKESEEPKNSEAEHKLSKQPWSKEEDAKLQLLISDSSIGLKDLEKFFPTKKPSSIKHRFDIIKYNAKTGRWTPQEISLFERGLEEFGQNWSKVSQFVGTRSPLQCQKRFYCTFGDTWKPNFKTKFTTEDTKLIFDLIEEYSANDWNTISYFFGSSHTRKQIQNHYYSQLCAKESKKPWTPEEDAVLIAAVESSERMAWDEIANHSGLCKNWLSCSRRWSEINPYKKTGDWSIDELVLLNQLAKKYTHQWSTISFFLKTRSSSECVNMWYYWNFPHMKYTTWNDVELSLLDFLQSSLGNNRHAIACHLGTRTSDAVKAKIIRDLSSPNI